MERFDDKGIFRCRHARSRRKIEENGQIIGDDTLEKKLVVFTSAEEAIKKLQKYIDVGFTEIVLTNSSPSRKELVKIMSEKIIPHFNDK